MWKNYPRNMPYKAKPNNYKCTTYLCDIKSHCAIDMHYAIVQGLTVFPKKTCSMEGSRHYITSPKKPTSQNFFVVYSTTSISGQKSQQLKTNTLALFLVLMGLTFDIVSI